MMLKEKKCGCSDELKQVYSAILASVDWLRDVRKVETICRDSLKIARCALAVYKKECENE